MKEYLLFDLDGTLTDSKLGITKCVQYALKEFGIDEPNLDKLECFIGPPLRYSFKEFYGLSDEDVEKAVAKYRERYEDKGIFENEVYDGIPHLLRILKAKKLHLAVASSKPQVYVDKILEHFDIKKYFDVVVGSDLSGKRENKADIVREAINQLFKDKPIELEKVYMIGDRKFDVIGAAERRVESVGVGYGFGSIEELMENKADYIVKTVDELEQFLLRDVRAKAAEDLKKQTPFKKISVILYSFLIFMAVRFIVVYCVNLFMLSLSGGISTKLTDFLVVLNEDSSVKGFTPNASAIMSMAGFAVAALAIRKTAQILIKRNKIDNKLLYLKPEPLSSKIIIVIAAVSAAIGLNIILDALGVTTAANYDEIAQSQYSANILIGILCYGIISPLSEELLFRGIIYNYLKRLTNAKNTIFISALIFGLYHVNVAQGIYAFLFGLLIAYSYQYFGSFYFPIILHMSANIIVYIISSLYLSGLIPGLSLGIGIVFFVLSVFCLYLLNKRKKIF